jgi:hypothetical protein
MKFTYIYPNLMSAAFGSTRNRIIVIMHPEANVRDEITAVPGTKVVLVGPVDESLWLMMEERTRRQFQEMVPVSADAYTALREWLAEITAVGINPLVTRLDEKHTVYRLETYPPILVFRNQEWTKASWQLAGPSNILLVGDVKAMRQYMLLNSQKFQDAAKCGESTRQSLRQFFGLQAGRGRPSKEFLLNGLVGG